MSLLQLGLWKGHLPRHPKQVLQHGVQGGLCGVQGSTHGLNKETALCSKILPSSDNLPIFLVKLGVQN